MVDVEKEMMKEIMADYHSGDPRDCEKKSVNKILL